LIELLIVIAIIGVLASLLLPALVRTKGAAKRIHCTNNQKQLDVAWLMYSGDHCDGLVSNGEVDPPDPSRKLWVQGAFWHVLDDTNSALLLDPSYALFADYFSNAKIYFDPTYPNMVTFGGVPYPKIRSYALNAYLGWTGRWDTRLAIGFKVFRKQSDLVALAPSQIFTFQDVDPNSTCWPCFGVRMDADQFFNWPNNEHSRGGVIAYGDGHVEHHRWEDPRTVLADSDDYHRHMDPSPNNVDLAWLRERTTIPGK
jgi:prepilin-type processing-associated H-X9-DG protein